MTTKGNGNKGAARKSRLIKFVTSSKENNEQFKSNRKNFDLLKNKRLVVYMAQDELRGKIQEIIHNNLIIQQEDY